MSGPLAPPGSWLGADAYEAYVGRWSRSVAPPFLDWLDIPPAKRWLDVGCGTGALSQAILAACAPVEVVGVDPSLPFVAHAAIQVADARAAFRKGDAERLPVDHRSFDAVVSGLVLNFVPDQPAALREMCGAARAGGVVAAYVWDYADGMQLVKHFWDAAVEAAPAAGGLLEDLRFTMCRPEPLRDLVLGAGLTDVAVEEIVVPTPFPDFGDYWSHFLGGQGPAPAYAMSLPRRTGRRCGSGRVPASPSRTTARSGSPPARGPSAARSRRPDAETHARPTSAGPASTGSITVHRCRRADPQLGAVTEGHPQVGTAPVARSAQQPRGAP